ncbi:hypothetical protein [Lysinibacillus sp. NPDC086135]|uniref:hypothetical protein n=1 Tax=Lysinibacillus sp. NPDC086135 TaxID=3364130 RepID=UPI0037F3540D
MNSDITNLKNTFDSIINEYDNSSLFHNDDSMITWNAKCEWFIKQMVDLRVGAGLEYFQSQKEFNPLQENSNVGEGEESE